MVGLLCCEIDLCALGQYKVLLNDREFWLILLIRDWPRRAFLDRTSE